MKVGRRLKGNLVTISPDENLEVAFQLMVTNKIRHLPVVEEDRLVGILSERDLKSALIHSRNDRPSHDFFVIPPGVPVSQVMTQDPIQITPDTDVEEAARVMYRQKIGSLPVVEKGRVVGIITESDILAIFIEIMGVIESSSRVDVEMDEDPDSLNRAADIIRRKEGRIISIAMAAPDDERRRTYYFRLASCDTSPIVEALREEGFEVKSAEN
jgi:acetoin utilization protein AcuB